MGFFDFGKKEDKSCPISVEKIEDLKKNKIIYNKNELVRCHKLIDPLKSLMKKDYVTERHILNKDGSTKEIQFIGLTTQEYNDGVVAARKEIEKSFAIARKIMEDNAKKNKTSGGKKKKSNKK
jgi:predicted component of type VI protein secretion system